MSTLYSIGLMNQLGDALEAEGFTPDDVTKLRSHSKLDLLLSFARGQAEIAIREHVINCDADPFVPDGWKVEEHKKGGQLCWNSDDVSLYFCDKQNSGSIEGNELRKKLEGQLVLNACVLDYLLANPQLIPDEWKSKAVFFWGTIYRNSRGRLYVRYLCWRGEQWYWNYDWLDDRWLDYCPAAVACKTR